jgi:L-rhamnose-H+ transport protein
MNFNILVGILLIAVGAFSSGSFAVPFGKIKGWGWETYWMIFRFGAYILFPFAACLIVASGFLGKSQRAI